MATIVQCPHCSKKLKMQAIPAGKKVRCPGCQQAFAPTALKPPTAKTQPAAAAPAAPAAAVPKPKPKAKPKPKRRPAPVEDDFEDFGDDMYGDDAYDDGDDGFEDEYDEQPRRPQRAAKGGKKGAASGKGKKKAAGSKSKAPLFVGIGVLCVALIGGVAFMLMSGGDDPAGGGSDALAAAGTDAAADPNAAAAPLPGAGHDAAGAGAATPGGPAGHGGGAPTPGSAGQPGAESTAAANTGSSADPAATAASSDAQTSSAGQPGSADIRYLPAESEAFVQLDVKRLLDGPLGQLLQNPMATQPLQEFRDKTGFGPEDIQSITVGLGGITDAVVFGRPPQPADLPFTAVIRATTSVDSARILSAIPNSENVTDGGLTYVRVPENPPIAIWLADSTTAVVGTESSVKQVAIQSGSSLPTRTSLDMALLDGQSTIQVLFSPRQPDAVFRHPKARVPDNVPGAPPASMALARTFLQHAKGVAIGFDFTNDLGFTAAARCNDSAGANALSQAITAAKAEGDAQSQAQSQNMPPMMAPFLQINKTMSESFAMQVDGDQCRFTMSAPGAGQQVAMLAPMMLGPAIMQAQAAAKRTQSRNNLKEIALAMHNFHDVYGRLPNAAPQSPTGEKWLSWRVHLLPFLGHEDLYQQFALEEPWDSPTNRPLADKMPDVYRSPKADLSAGHTLYQVVIGPGTMYENAEGRSFRDCTDGTSNTILAVEVAPDRAVYWTQPNDFTFEPNDVLAGLGGVEPNTFQAVFTDGHVQMVSMTTDPQTVKAMFTRNGGEQVTP
ncbi:MAG: DUF1559 domain-containing protein [Fuerstiella sp.]